MLYNNPYMIVKCYICLHDQLINFSKLGHVFSPLHQNKIAKI